MAMVRIPSFVATTVFSSKLTSVRRIFIIEGLFTSIAAIVGKFLIVDWPENANFLTEDERKLLVARLAADVADARMNRLDKPAYKRIFSDWKIYCGILMYFGIINTGYAVSVRNEIKAFCDRHCDVLTSDQFFGPTILTELGYSPVQAQVHSIPIFSKLLTSAARNLRS